MMRSRGTAKIILNHKTTYNPRIDFNICKQLLCSLPYEFDELKLRDCFIKEIGTLPYEKDIIAIKSFFTNFDITKATMKEVQELYKICTNKEMALEGEIVTVDDIQELQKIIQFVEKQNCEAVTLFQILLLFGYCKINNVPIIPYRGISRCLYLSLLEGDLNKADRSWRSLLYRKNKFCKLHALKENQFCLEQLQKYKSEFLQTVDAVKLGVYGSLARGAGTEYSDIDLIVIVEEGADCKDIKMKSYEFWSDKMTINYDICVTTEEDMPNLPVAIRNTIKII